MFYTINSSPLLVTKYVFIIKIILSNYQVSSAFIINYLKIQVNVEPIIFFRSLVYLPVWKVPLTQNKCLKQRTSLQVTMAIQMIYKIEKQNNKN